MKTLSDKTRVEWEDGGFILTKDVKQFIKDFKEILYFGRNKTNLDFMEELDKRAGEKLL